MTDEFQRVLIQWFKLLLPSVLLPGQQPPLPHSAELPELNVCCAFSSQLGLLAYTASENRFVPEYKTVGQNR